MNVRIYLITDVIVSIVDTRPLLPSETLERNVGRNATWTLLRMVGMARHQMWVGLATFARTILNNT